MFVRGNSGKQTNEYKLLGEEKVWNGICGYKELLA